MLHKWLKPLALTLGLWVGLASQAFAFGTLPLSMVQQFDSSGKPLAGCLLWFFQAGTVSTPQNAYSDTGLTQALPNPLSCDATGRVPQFWLADGLIHIRLTDSSGVVYLDTTMQVLGPSSGSGGGGGTVDPTTIAQTGDEKIRYGTGPISGWVRENGLTIGNATSGATERANADTQNLFVYLYNTDPNLVVSGGRTGNALNDYNAGKTIALPDMRGRFIAGLADMGNTAASWLTSTYFGASPTTLGAVSNTTDHTTLATANLPPYTPSGSITTTFPSTISGDTPFAFAEGGNPVGYGGASSGGTPLGLAGLSLNSTWSGTAQGGTDTPFSSIPPAMLRTIYIKL